MKLITAFWAMLLGLEPLMAADKLVIISPHRKSIQEEYIPLFEQYYKKTFGTEIQVDWLDQGGTSDDVRFLEAKYAKDPKTSGIDIFWGGGATTYIDLENSGILSPYEIPKELQKQVPMVVAGVPLRSNDHKWVGTALSSFGMFFNKKVLKFTGLQAPKTWKDLADPKYDGQISLTDPRRSGSASIMNQIILQTFGFEEGFRLLTEIGGNVRQFTHSSSDPIKAVVSGDVAIAMAIDFYANAKIGDLGVENLGFTLPEGQTVLDPDPIAVLTGAPNRKAAERFVNFVLSKEGQSLLILKKGVEGGPRLATLGRMAVNKDVYVVDDSKKAVLVNPFEQKSQLKFDKEKAATLSRPLNDLIGAVMVDTHKELREAWQAVIKGGMKPDQVKAVSEPPVSEEELLTAAKKWDDEVFRNQQINKWVEFARTKYKKIVSGT